jgi:hypothetical protein
MTISVSLDIAGFYYFRGGIAMPNNATIRDVMDEARRLDLSAYAARQTTPVLDYKTSLSNEPYIDSITVHHIAPAVSRQRRAGGVPREYEPGEYTFRSDGVISTGGTVPLKPYVAVNIVGEQITRPVTATWQYYLYDANGVEEARRYKTSDERVKIPFSKLDRSNALSEGCTIVWRAVVIMIAPTRPKSIKGA